MPRKRIPQDEVVRQYPNFQQRAPDNRRRRFRKTLRTDTRFARAAWLDGCQNLERRSPTAVVRDLAGSALRQRRYNVCLFAEQHALRSHRDSAEMTTAITERFADY